MSRDNRLIASTLALITGAALAAHLVAPTPARAASPSAEYALGTIYEDVWGAPLYSTDDVASFVVNGLPLDECEALRDHLNGKGGFTACFGADVSTVAAPPAPTAPSGAPVDQVELHEIDAAACAIARAVPTDANLEACYGE